MDERLAADVKAALRAFPEWPVPGVRFQDAGPLLADPALLARAVDAMAEPFAGRVDKVAAVESRGFLFGAPVALRLGVGVVPVRKAGKLPGATLRETYALEYGQATLEIQRDAFRPGERVLLVDDVLATAGTARAAARLVGRTKARVVGFSFLLEIAALEGRSRLDADARVVASV